MHGFVYLLCKSLRIGICAHYHRHLRERPLQRRPPESRMRIRTFRFVLHITDDFPECVGVGPIQMRERLIDHDDLWPVCIVRPRKKSPSFKRYAQCAEVIPRSHVVPGDFGDR